MEKGTVNMWKVLGRAQVMCTAQIQTDVSRSGRLRASRTGVYLSEGQRTSLDRVPLNGWDELVKEVEVSVIVRTYK